MSSLVIFEDTPAGYSERGSLENDQGKRQACRFSRAWLRECSGVDDPSFGFKDGKPCIIVKLNRIVNFRPRVGTLHIRNIFHGNEGRIDVLWNSSFGKTISSREPMRRKNVFRCYHLE